MANKVFVTGNMTRDVEIFYTASGFAIGSFAIAINKKKKDSQGEYEEHTIFLDIKALGKTAETLAAHTSKGSKLYIEGHIDIDQWTTDDGSKRSKMYVLLDNFEFMGCKNNNRGESSPSVTPTPARTIPSENIPEVDIDEDEIPF